MNLRQLQAVICKAVQLVHDKRVSKQSVAHERFGNEVLFKRNGAHEPLDAAVQAQIRFLAWELHLRGKRARGR